MKSKVALLLFSILTAFLLNAQPVLAAEIIIDGEQLDVPAIVENGTTLVPLREIFETLGASVTWDQATQTVTAVKDEAAVVLQIGNNSALRNGEPVNLPVPGKVINNSTMVPLRFVSEAMGAEVNWDSSSGSIIINSPATHKTASFAINPTLFANPDPLYNKVLTGLQNGQAKVTYTTNDRRQYGDIDKIMAITQSVLQDHPYLNYMESFEIKVSSGSGIKIEINFNYKFTQQEIRAMIAAVEEKSLEIIQRVIRPGMTDLQKERALHDYIVLNTSYDYDNYQRNTIPRESYTAYGVLIQGVGVCQGYASAMQKLLTMAGIEAQMVIGTGTSQNGPEPHGWNKVKIDGRWYHLDTTWDDPVPDVPGTVSHKYFNLTDAQMSKDHSWQDSQQGLFRKIP